MLGPEGQRRALHGLVQTRNEDFLVARHGKTPLTNWPVDAGYPTLGDTDAGNPDKGALVVTWRFTLPASLTLGNVYDNVQVVDRDGRVVVSVACPVAVAKEAGKALMVYVNEHIL